MEIQNNRFQSSPSQYEYDQLQILLAQKLTPTIQSTPPDDVRITINDHHDSRPITRNDDQTAPANPIWRDTSYDFTKDSVMKRPDSSKHYDFISESPLSKLVSESSSVNRRVSFNQPEFNSRSNAGPQEAVLCSGNSSFRRKSSFLRSRTKSRLLDPPGAANSRSYQSTPRMGKSQGFGKSEIDEDDPFLEEDLPDYYKKMRFSMLSVMQLVSLILIIAALVCSLTINVLKARTVFELKLWKWELMVLVLISGRLVSGLFIRIAVFFIERNFLLRKRVLYFVYGLRNGVQNCIWLALVLIAWQSIFDQKVNKVTNRRILPYVTKIWVCLLVGTLIWLLKTLLVKVLASTFHVSAFFDRIQETLYNQYVIETLSEPPLVEIQQEMEEDERVMDEVEKFQNAGITVPSDIKAYVFARSGRVIGTPRKSTVPAGAMSLKVSRLSSSRREEGNGITIDHLHRLNQKNISAWNMKRLMNIVRKGAISTLDENIQDATVEDEGHEAMVQITSENQAKAAARNIFVNVAQPGSKYIYEEDLLRYMREDEVLKTMRLFDGITDQKRISKRTLKNWVVNAFRERRALALSLNDTKTAVSKLHQMLNVLVGVIIVVIWLLILRVATTQFLIFLSSQLVLVAFMFGNTCKTTFESIIFLFVMHPFDVGDRVDVEGVQMVVEEMNILTTVFLKFDNHKIYYPNSVLATKPIHNYYRSPDMGDAIDFAVLISTPVEKITLMKERITSYIVNKSDHWASDPMVVMRDVEDMNRLKWSVWLTHTINFQDMGERFLRRSLLVEEMIKIFRELDIEYRMVPLEVNVRNMPPLQSNRLPSSWTACPA